jgi:ABC-2 type transport system permease protein
MRVKAVARRILIQIIHDRRTFALMILAPLLMLSLIYLLLDDSATQISIAVINAPEGYVDNLYENNVTTVRASESEARRLLDKGKVTASVNMKAGKLYIDIDGSNSVKTEAALKMMETAKQGITPSRPDLKSDINYIYGYEDITMFDNFGALLWAY